METHKLNSNYSSLRELLSSSDMPVVTKTFLTPYGVNARYPLLKEGSTISLVNENGEEITTISTTGLGVADPTTTLITYSALTTTTGGGVITMDMLNGAHDSNTMMNPANLVSWSYIDALFETSGNKVMGYIFYKSIARPAQLLSGAFRVPSHYDAGAPTQIIFTHTVGANYPGFTLYLKLDLQVVRPGTASTSTDYSQFAIVIPPAQYMISQEYWDIPLTFIQAGDYIDWTVTRVGILPYDTYPSAYFLVGMEFQCSVTTLTA